MYLWFAVIINLGMSYIAHGFSFQFFFYSLITTIFPVSVYYTADELSKKMYTPAVQQTATASSPDRPKRTYKKRRKTKLLE
jgi:hypothetical protein